MRSAWIPVPRPSVFLAPVFLAAWFAVSAAPTGNLERRLVFPPDTADDEVPLLRVDGSPDVIHLERPDVRDQQFVSAWDPKTGKHWAGNQPSCIVEWHGALVGVVLAGDRLFLKHSLPLGGRLSRRMGLFGVDVPKTVDVWIDPEAKGLDSEDVDVFDLENIFVDHLPDDSILRSANIQPDRYVLSEVRWNAEKIVFKFAFEEERTPCEFSVDKRLRVSDVKIEGREVAAFFPNRSDSGRSEVLSGGWHGAQRRQVEQTKDAGRFYCQQVQLRGDRRHGCEVLMRLFSEHPRLCWTGPLPDRTARSRDGLILTGGVKRGKLWVCESRRLLETEGILDRFEEDERSLVQSGRIAADDWPHVELDLSSWMGEINVYSDSLRASDEEVHLVMANAGEEKLEVVYSYRDRLWSVIQGGKRASLDSRLIRQVAGGGFDRR